LKKKAAKKRKTPAKKKTKTTKKQGGTEGKKRPKKKNQPKKPPEKSSKGALEDTVVVDSRQASPLDGIDLGGKAPKPPGGKKRGRPKGSAGKKKPPDVPPTTKQLSPEDVEEMIRQAQAGELDLVDSDGQVIGPAELSEALGEIVAGAAYNLTTTILSPEMSDRERHSIAVLWKPAFAVKVQEEEYNPMGMAFGMTVLLMLPRIMAALYRVYQHMTEKKDSEVAAA